MPLNFPSAPTVNTTYSFNSKTWTYNGNAWALSTGGSLNTSVVPEGSNLYFSNARVYSNVSQLGYITSSSLSGYATNTQLGSYATNAQLALYATTSNVALKANIADLTAANITGTTLNSSIVTSSLTSVGTLGSLTVTNNASAGAYLTAGNSTAANFQTTGNVNTNNLRVVTNSSVGTVVSGTWNGASISTTYTDAKVVSVNGSSGVVTGLATTAGTLAQFGATTSAQLLGIISDETGSGSLVFATSPTLVTPVIGAATGTSLSVSGNIIVSSGNTTGNGLILSDDGDIVDMNDGFASMRFSSGVKIKSSKYSATDAITLASTGTLTATGNVNSASLRVTTASSLGTVQSGTWNGSSISTVYTDAKVTSVNGSTGAITGLATTAGTLAQFGATTSAQLLGVISDETGSGALVFATSPTLVTPALGTPSSGTLTNCTFPTLNQNTTGSAATLTTSRNINGVAFNGSADITVTAAAGTLSGATLASGVTASSLTSFGNSPTLVTPNLGTPSAVVLTNASGTASSLTANIANFINVTDDTTTNATRYPIFANGTSGAIVEQVSSTKLFFNPSTGLLTSTDYNSSSDKKLKKNIKTVDNALDKVMALRGVSFDWKEGGARAIGLIAQEAEKVIPEIVSKDDNGYLGIKYNNLIGVLVEAIKDQQEQINILKKQIEKL